MSRDTEQLARTLNGVNVRAFRQFTPAKETPAKETSKVNGVSLNSDGTVSVNGTRYTRDEFRGALEMNIKAQREDPKSAYSNARDPNHKQAVEEINLAYRWLGGELTESDEKQIVTEWHEAIQESSEVANTEPFQQIAEMMRDPEARTALQRAKVGQPLDARQAAIVSKHNELLAANNSQARKEAAGAGGTFKITRPPSIPSELFALEKIQDPRERTFAIRELRSRWRDDKASPYNDVNHPEHRNHVSAMQRLYQEEETLGRQPEDPE